MLYHIAITYLFTSVNAYNIYYFYLIFSVFILYFYLYLVCCIITLSTFILLFSIIDYGTCNYFMLNDEAGWAARGLLPSLPYSCQSDIISSLLIIIVTEVGFFTD